ncbi:MAG TPA: diacylglycerol kinase family protein [Cellulomonas sp.]|uniref:diacylglycerol/lipid kinase family protein n=1 Tax=Cellulomonas sp. TaxID=40001 RepID=UPI002E2F0007|nr:diacylglycerol kinase family protein [Cellulomonas sp.]HEX5333517.1 diacylglycerol kinase family protein [Cellulomonas sp.]
MATNPVRPAVVLNPSKFAAGADPRREIGRALEAAGIDDVLWFETTAEDPGRGQCADALAAGADLVLACGGDGTVRACAAALTGGDVPLGLLPAGTGNLLARNLGIPTDLESAAKVIGAGHLRRIDVPALDGEPFVVMGGAGFDAQLFERTSDELKSRIGWAAYALAGARAMRDVEPMSITLELDGRSEVVSGIGVVVGNVGTLTGGIILMPDAEPDDGMLDVAILTPRRWFQWIGLGVNIVIGRRPQPWQLQRRRAAEIVVRWPAQVPVEIDGDLRDPADVLTFTVSARALAVCVPVDE